MFRIIKSASKLAFWYVANLVVMALAFVVKCVAAAVEFAHPRVSRIAFAAWVVIVVWNLYWMVGEKRSGGVFTAHDALSSGLSIAIFLLTGLLAGLETRDKSVREARLLRAECAKWYKQYREMVEKNKTMIDDVLAAQAAGIKTKTFLFGGVPDQVRESPDRSPEFRL